MTDNPESAGAVEPGTPNPETSQQPASTPSGSQDVGELVKAILSHPDFQRQTQSVKDKRIAEIEKGLEGQSSEIARLATALGHTPEEIRKAQTQIAIEDMVNERFSRQVPDQKPPGSGVDLASARTSILKRSGLERAPNGFDDYLAGLDWSDPIQSTLDATAWVAEKKAETRQPSAADTAPPIGNSPASSLSGMSVDELGTKMINLQKNPGKNWTQIQEINAELARRDT